MKRQSVMNRTALSILAISLLMVVVTLGAVALAALIGGGALIANAPAGLVADNTVTTEVAKEKSVNLLRPDISDKITKIMPSAVPLDTLLRKAGAHSKTTSIDFKFYSSELRPFMDEITEDLVYDALNPAGTFVVKPQSHRIWQANDTLIFHDENGKDVQPLVAHITSINRSIGELTLIFLNGWDADPANGGEGSQPGSENRTILSGTKVGRIGNAKAELDAKTPPYGHLPTDRWNYVQSHMSQIEESLWQKVHNKEVNWDIRDMQTLALYDLRCQMEGTSLFGVRRVITDIGREDNPLIYHSGGIIRFIENTINIPAAGLPILDPDFASWTKQIFVGNAGSDTRYLFVGSDLNERLMNVPHIMKQIDGNSTEVKHGITFSKIETGFGVLLVRHHQLLNYHGFADKGIVIDLNNIRKRVFMPMGVRKLDLMSSGIKRANAYVLEETFGLETRYADTHAILRP